MIITSKAFTDNGIIPEKHTGFGEDISPQFEIHDMPEGTVSLAIIMDDLDVPFAKEFNHWVAWNIPAGEEIPEGIRACHGIGWGRNRYRGPKPLPFTKKEHRYVFHVFALDCMPDIPEESDKKTLLNAMKDHVLDEGKITGRYGRY